MNKATEYIKAYNLKNKYGITDGDIYETLFEGDEVWRGDFDSHRWWNTYTAVIRLEDKLIMYQGAETTGDMSPEETGWSFDKRTVSFAEEKEVTTKTYVPVK